MVIAHFNSNPIEGWSHEPLRFVSDSVMESDCFAATFLGKLRELAREAGRSFARFGRREVFQDGKPFKRRWKVLFNVQLNPLRPRVLIFPEGRVVVGGWTILAKKLRDLNAAAEVKGGEQKTGNACRRGLSLREWSFIMEMAEVNTGGSHSNEKQTLECSASANEQKEPMEASTFVFINHAAIAWHDRRREWVGDQSQKSQRKQKDPIISWSMTYEDLLSTNEPFSEPIPLTEMVDFLVDIWQDEGLYD
ncbi:hypothetical protein AAG906_034479 [Vitis piasezkii]